MTNCEIEIDFEILRLATFIFAAFFAFNKTQAKVFFVQAIRMQNAVAANETALRQAGN
ncbi:MAG: hypothetical protein QM737_18510 [Ferruginibacter sp.]